MKPILICGVFGFFCSLSACGTLSPEQQQINTDVLNTVIKAVDRNNDSIVTNQEIKANKNDPSFWIGIGASILGLLGLTKAQGTKKDVDALYDATHAPIVK